MTVRLKVLTETEFRERVEALTRAREIFIKSGVTDNISDAYAIYRRVLEEYDVPEELTTQGDPKRLLFARRFKERPVCPECGTEMGLRLVTVPQGKGNREGYKTCWECPKCGHEDYSKKSLRELLEEKGK